MTALRQRGGWSPVNDAYEEFPASTEQIIHPAAYPSEAPESVSVPDRSRAGWSRYDLHPRADTVGEASIYAMLWANGQLPETSPLSYDAAPSAGWAGDAVYPYRDGDRNGYVWRTRWDTREDALDFFAAYLTVLAAHNATREGSAFVVSPPDPFADAFRVTQSGRTVTVVNGPDVDSLAEIHPRGTDESAPGTRANHPLPIEPSPPVIGTETDPATAG